MSKKLTTQQVKDLLVNTLNEIDLLTNKAIQIDKHEDVKEQSGTWTLPAAGVLYEGRTRSHPQENAQQPTSTVESYFAVIIAVERNSADFFDADEPLDLFDEIIEKISSLRLENGKHLIFLSERVIDLDKNVILWAQRYRLATALPNIKKIKTPKPFDYKIK